MVQVYVNWNMENEKKKRRKLIIYGIYEMCSLPLPERIIIML